MSRQVSLRPMKNSSSQTENAVVLSLPLDLRDLRSHVQPPLSAPFSAWTDSQKKLYLGEARFIGPPSKADSLTETTRMAIKIDEEISQNSRSTGTHQQVRSKPMKTESMQTDIALINFLDMERRLEMAERESKKISSELESSKLQIKTYREAMLDWNSDSKWEKLVKTEEGKQFLDEKLDELINKTVNLIISDETDPTKSKEARQEQIERKQARQAMLFKLKAIQSLQTQLPHDFINISSKFVGIKLEYPPELLTFLKMKEANNTGILQNEPEVELHSHEIPPEVLAKIHETSNALSKQGEVRRENFERLKGKVRFCLTHILLCLKYILIIIGIWM